MRPWALYVLLLCLGAALTCKCETIKLLASKFLACSTLIHIQNNLLRKDAYLSVSLSVLEESLDELNGLLGPAGLHASL